MERNIRLLAGSTAIRSLGVALYAPFLALFLRNVLGLAYDEIGLLLFLTGLIALPAGLAGGLLTDRVGRRRLILWGLAGEAVATLGLAYAFAQRSLPEAIAAATVGGIIATAAGPAGAAYLADLVTGAERTRGYTAFRIGFNAGYSAGVTMGGLLVSSVGFAGSVGLAALLIGGAAVLLGLLLDPTPYDRALEGSPGRRPTGPGPLASGPPGRSTTESLRLLVRDRAGLEVMVAIVLASLTLGQWSVTLPLYAHNVLGVSYTVLGLGLALNGLLVVFGQAPMTGRAVGQRHTTLAVGGILLYVVAFLGLGVAARFSWYPEEVFFVAIAVLTLGENLEAIPQMTLPSNLAPPGEVGAYNGAFGVAGGIGYLSAILLGGFVLQLAPDPLVVWVLLVLPAVPAAILFRHVASRLPDAANRA